jgi:lipid-binding SYLF domain-containing protein
MQNALLKAALIAVGSSLVAATAQAQSTPVPTHQERQVPAQQAANAKELVRDATTTVNQMKQDPKLMNYVKEAKGIFIIPTLVKGSLIV